MIVALGSLLIVLATCAALRGAGTVPRTDASVDGDGDGGPYRDARRLVVHPWIPIPASSFQPYAAASSLLMLPATLDPLGLPGRQLLVSLQDDRVYCCSQLALCAVLMLVFSSLMHRPREMADLASRLGAVDSLGLAKRSRAALRAAWGPSFLLFVALVLASQTTWLSTMGLALATAIAMDFVHAVVVAARSNVGATGLVVWEEHRASAVPVLRAALAADGITTEVRGAAVLSYFQVFAPFAPAQILVDRDDQERARQTLSPLVLGEAPAARTPAARPPVTVPHEDWSLGRRTVAIGVVAGLAAALAAIPRAPARGANVARASLEVVEVDDSIDAFRAVSDDDVPEGSGIRIYRESAPLGKGTTGETQLAQIVARDGEGVPATRARLRKWLETLKLPAGARFGIEAMTEYDERNRRRVFVGLRTFVLAGEPVLTTNDVVDATVSTSDGRAYVDVTLSPAGRARFAEATRAWTGRRLAILLDGEIDTAPVVKQAILGGRISITVGAGELDTQVAEAKELASKLR